jgi:hypothetical protein
MLRDFICEENIFWQIRNDVVESKYSRRRNLFLLFAAWLTETETQRKVKEAFS